MSETMRLIRFASHPDVGVFGELTLPTEEVLLTVERPWKGNKVGESCIPEGVYPLKKRRSGIVERTSGGKYKEGWEVYSVHGRTYIMVHPANVPGDLEGCIGPGLGMGCLYGQWSVTDSRDAFDKFMSALERRKEWMIDIRWQRPPQWP